MYTETYGTGRPLVLLHGGYGAPAMFGPVLTALAAEHRVIAPHLRAHGRTPDEGRPLTVAEMADDVGQPHRGPRRAGRALGLLARWPGRAADRVPVPDARPAAGAGLRAVPPRRLGPADAGRLRGDDRCASMAVTMQGTPAYAFFARPPEEWPGFVNRMGRLLSREYDMDRGTRLADHAGDGGRRRPRLGAPGACRALPRRAAGGPARDTAGDDPLRDRCLGRHSPRPWCHF